MNQPTTDIKPPRSTPSTPPLFGLSSPDFKNFKSWVRTSPFTSDFDLSKDKLQLSDMDFEAAYAMLTAKTPPTASQHASNPPSNSHTPITSYQSELTSQLHELHNQRDFGHKITSPGLSHLMIQQHGSVSPNFSPSELESLPIFSNYDELLSVNESNAIEQFLDSIMDDQNGAKGPKQLQPPLQTLIPDSMIYHEHKEEEEEDVPTSKFEEVIPKFIETPETSTDTISITLNNTKNVKIPKKNPNIFPKELNISNEVPSIPSRSSSTSSTSEKQAAKRRKLLTEDEKKFNHTTSEQRRRSIIKDAFDDLVRLLPLANKNKKQSKSLVLETAANEIERILKINNELKQLLNKTN